MDKVRVNSSNISSIGYDPMSQTLEVAFNSGGIYQYYNVPENIYINLMNAGSKGKYHHTHIKGRYNYKRV